MNGTWIVITNNKISYDPNEGYLGNTTGPMQCTVE